MSLLAQWNSLEPGLKKRLLAEARKERVARESIQDALDGETKTIVGRLRVGRSSAQERAFLADLIEGKIKVRRRRPGQLPRQTHEAIPLFVFLLEAIHSGQRSWPRKRIIGRVCDLFGVKDRRVYNALKALEPKRREALRQAMAAVAEDYLARK
jgi:hypothetical protein